MQKRQLEIIKFNSITGGHDIYMFSRANMVRDDASAVFGLQRAVHEMVKDVKKLPVAERKTAADAQIKLVMALYGPCMDYFDNVEQSVREYARILWPQY